MEFKFIAINGDNVGEGIGNAIATDNHEELSNITSNIKEAHGGLEEWVTSNGGEIITSSGDECIFKIPAEYYSDEALETIKEDYSNTSGHTVTIGCGDSMSEASKALIYGKMNDKDQIVEYDSSIDDYISDYDDSEEMEYKEDDSQEGFEEDANEVVEDEDSSDELDAGFEGESVDELDEESESTPEEGSIENSFTYENEKESEEDPEYSEYEDEELDEEYSEDSLEEDAQETGIEGETVNEETDETLMEEGELSDTEELSTEDQINEFNEDDLQPEHEKDLSEEEDFIHDAQENMDDEMDEDIVEADEEGSSLEDMIYANMEDDQDVQEGQEASPEDKDNLKGRIAEILISFKENKMVLEEMKGSNPAMYESSMAMLDSMIEMAKMLQMDPQAHADEIEATAAMPDADLDAGEYEEESEGDEYDDPTKENELFQKNEEKIIKKKKTKKK